MKREILFRGKRICENKNWVEGCLLNLDTDSGHVFIVPFFHGASTLPICRLVEYRSAYVNPETVGQFTGVYDTELTKIYEGDIVRFLRYVCTVVFEEGCFGLALNINDAFDWDYIDEEMKEYAGTNQITACFNDHFISLWEILWNFNCDQNICNVVEVIGNIHDNPELLEGGVKNDC